MTLATLQQAEQDAAAQNIKVNALLSDREYPVEVLALAAALDEAISAEHTGRMYDVPRLIAKGQDLRAGVEGLAKLWDAKVLA